MSQIRPGVLIAVLVLVAFVVYAFFAPATYRSSALIAVEPVAPIASAAPALIPEPLEAARRLRDAILDRSTLDRLAQERAGSAAADLRARAASQVRDALAIDTSDARAFGVSYSDSDAARAQRICGELAEHGVEQAPLALDVSDRERSAALKRQHQTQELAAFLTLHPELAGVQTNEARPDRMDVALSALRAEKASVERRLADEKPSDNPYDDPADSNPALLKRRLAELDAAIVVRKKSLENQAAAQKLSPELAAEYRRLVEAVANGGEAETPQPRLTAKLVSGASKSRWPVEPNRPLLLFFGVVFGVGFGSAYTLVARASQRRRASSRPSPPSNDTQKFTVPKAPGLPKGLGIDVLGATMPLPKSSSSSPPPASGKSPPATAPPPTPMTSAPPLAGAALPTNTLPIERKEPSVGMPGLESAAPPPTPGQPPSTSLLGNAPARSPLKHTLVGMAAPVLPSEPPLARADPHAEAPAGEHDPVLAAAAQAWDQAVRTNNVPGFAVVGSPGGRVAESNPPPPASAGGPLPREDGPARLAHRVHKVTQPLGSFLPDSLTEGSSYSYETQEGPQPSYPPPAAGSRPLAASNYPPRSPLPAKGPPSAATSYSYVHAAPVATSGVVRVEQLTGWVQPSELKPGAQRQICEQLYPFAVDRSLVTVVVAVPAALEFKSRVAAELALALAASGHPRVLLLEADFHRPRVHRTLRVDMPMGSGFSQQLHARIHSGQRPSWAVVGCTPTLHVAAEGMMRSPGLLGSQFFDEAVRDFKSYYDFVVIDGPSSSLEVDSGPLNAVSDALVVVCPPNDADSLLQVNALFEQKRVSAVAVIPAT